jgi:hypothetical protein
MFVRGYDIEGRDGKGGVLLKLWSNTKKNTVIFSNIPHIKMAKKGRATYLL